MELATGSRNYQNIDYKAISILSGLDYTLPMKKLGNTIILRRDLVNYSYEWLSYKIGLTESNIDIAVVWSKDEWETPHNKIYRPLQDDVSIFFGVMNKFNTNFDKANTWKVQY
jgi:hypothetical protein